MSRVNARGEYLPERRSLFRRPIGSAFYLHHAVVTGENRGARDGTRAPARWNSITGRTRAPRFLSGTNNNQNRTSEMTRIVLLTTAIVTGLVAANSAIAFGGPQGRASIQPFQRSTPTVTARLAPRNFRPSRLRMQPNASGLPTPMATARSAKKSLPLPSKR